MRKLPKRMVIATRNAGKAAEFRALFAPLGIEVESLLDVEQAVPEVEEDGDTFSANAEKKARAVAEALGAAALADDSGLCVDALGGAPGVRSARYAGEPSNDARNNALLLDNLRGRQADGVLPPNAPPNALSTARFVCALALVDPTQERVWKAEAACEGVIVAEARGEGGFGYDPLFYVPSLGKTFAEMDRSEKNANSHRGKALRAFVAQLEGAGGVK